MQKNILGKSELEASILGFGGIMLNNVEQERANHMVKEAFEHGVNFFDVGPTYGNAEEKMGEALEPYRDDVILACKTEPDLSKDEVVELLNSST